MDVTETIYMEATGCWLGAFGSGRVGRYTTAGTYIAEVPHIHGVVSMLTIPEPSTALLTGVGLLLLAIHKRPEGTAEASA